ncbi:MAG: transporter substrate-binding domain-containing protein [Natronospirillum sp.]|uniref:substrate-binding periplasmic protein n=1 Tax=Natronospirillum sp. TaxID=2812955 RepID=UPI0025E809F5|nr:transporter substrate-binding domain-containing protein [Natronospirillum sp.]MCH8550789.1 transporter substrate-binding domain-containing protein [Natronospirillum sp.]
MFLYSVFTSHRRLSILLAAIIGLTASLAKADTLVVAGDPWRPYLDPDVPNQGIAIEIVRESLATQGFDLDWEIMPWARALYGARDGEYDVLVGVWYTEERAQFLHYSDPFLANEVKLIKRAGDDFDYQAPEDLTGKRLGHIIEYAYGDVFDNGEHFFKEPAVNLVTNIRRLRRNMIDLTLEDELVARENIGQVNPDYLNDIEFVDTPISRNDMHLTVGQNHPDGEAIISAFNEGLMEIRENGTYDRILTDYNISQ